LVVEGIAEPQALVEELLGLRGFGGDRQMRRADALEDRGDGLGRRRGVGVERDGIEGGVVLGESEDAVSRSRERCESWQWSLLSRLYQLVGINQEEKVGCRKPAEAN
jgi:hypothetical protein